MAGKRAKRKSPSVSVVMGLNEILSSSVFYVNASTSNVSADGRRVHHRTIPVLPPSPTKRRRTDGPVEESSGGSGGQSEGLYSGAVGDNLLDDQADVPRAHAKRYASSDDPLKEWGAEAREEYLLEFLRLEGPGTSGLSTCGRCKALVEGGRPYRCKDCFTGDVMCQVCFLTAHTDHPLHRIERWDGRCFVASTLRDAGLRVQLGHPPGKACACYTTVNDFVVLHVNGIHTVTLRFCACDEAASHGSPRQQLLRRQWFPATFEQPQTCATIRLLEHFHMQNLQGKVTLYDYYSALQKLTDNSGLRRLPSRYKEFVRMKREYAHLKSLKRAGRAHDPSGVSGTKRGELTVACPACPDPEVNLPRDWESAPPERRFLYTLFIALDACFRLKRRMVSSVEKDPGLGIDWGYFVEAEPFRQYLLSVTDQKEMSTCSGLAALDYANSKFSRGYAATGVCLGVCARHEFIQPNGAADLQVGERYANMDYTFASLMRHHGRNLSVVVSYDIACQWSKSLLQRVKTLPPLVRLDLVSTMVRFAVPKLHIHSHTKHCQHNYSLNYLPGVGRTDGEGIERPWANIGATATSIRVMGPGARIETLNDHWGHWNWQKTVGLGSLLSRHLRLAVSERELQKASFEVFSEQQGARVDGWKRMIIDFECDSSKTNPYAVAYAGLSEHDVRLQFSQEEAAEASRGVPSLHDVTRSGFIVEALDIEEQQLKTRAIVRQKTAGTAVQASEILELRTKLTRSLGRLRVMQAVYLPMVLTSLGQRAVPDGEEAEMVPIGLPSSLSPDARALCDQQLVDIETRLWDARCQSALNGLRNLLFIKSRLVGYKDRNARHQAANTRTRMLIQRNEDKITLQARKYQASWTALKMLANGDESKIKWRSLRQEDIRCMEDPDVTKKKEVRHALATEGRRDDTVHGEGGEDAAPLVAREGYRTVSWIWMDAAEVGPATGEGMDEVLRSEFAKSWARVRRWTEEVALLREEMRRVTVSLRHRGQQWEKRATTTPHQLRPDYANGLTAYAYSQADLLYSLADTFEANWTTHAPIPEDADDIDKEDLQAEIDSATVEAEEDGEDGG
ncbi:hypothetical protein PTI98_002412 [Pleurotus ostreatus]|nr:hypothetical protein PTI98_002412 [Pleurotus ostreatus]